MKKEDLVEIYDQNYAESYNDRFLLEPGYKAAAEYEHKLLSNLINKNTRWLDVGCGTGFFLSKFPNTTRAGLDLSPEMLKIARKANPDALLFKEGDFRVPNAEWEQKWELVSSMWGAYVYLDSQSDIENFLQNIINWVAIGGTLFLPVIDYEDYRPSITIPYKEETYTRDNVSYGQSIIKSFTWDYIEYIGKNHYNLISLHLEYMIELISPSFDLLEIHYYPLEEGEKVPRKAIIAQGKRPVQNAHTPAAITRTQPIFSVKNEQIAKMQQGEMIVLYEQKPLSISYILKKIKPFNLSFWKRVYHFITS